MNGHEKRASEEKGLRTPAERSHSHHKQQGQQGQQDKSESTKRNRDRCRLTAEAAATLTVATEAAAVAEAAVVRYLFLLSSIERISLEECYFTPHLCSMLPLNLNCSPSGLLRPARVVDPSDTAIRPSPFDSGFPSLALSCHEPAVLEWLADRATRSNPQ